MASDSGSQQPTLPLDPSVNVHSLTCQTERLMRSTIMASRSPSLSTSFDPYGDYGTTGSPFPPIVEIPGSPYLWYQTDGNLPPNPWDGITIRRRGQDSSTTSEWGDRLEREFAEILSRTTVDVENEENSEDGGPDPLDEIPEPLDDGPDPLDDEPVEESLSLDIETTNLCAEVTTSIEELTDSDDDWSPSSWIFNNQDFHQISSRGNNGTTWIRDLIQGTFGDMATSTRQPLSDIELVCSQTGCTPEEARQALVRNDDDIVSAIMELS